MDPGAFWDLLDHLVPPELAQAIAPRADDIPFIAEQVTLWIKADEQGRAEILRFLEDNGPAQAARQKEEEATPDAATLENWLNDNDPWTKDGPSS
jgi:hypothetical protein